MQICSRPKYFGCRVLGVKENKTCGGAVCTGHGNGVMKEIPGTPLRAGMADNNNCECHQKSSWIRCNQLGLDILYDG